MAQLAQKARATRHMTPGRRTKSSLSRHFVVGGFVVAQSLSSPRSSEGGLPPLSFFCPFAEWPSGWLLHALPSHPFGHLSLGFFLACGVGLLGSLSLLAGRLWFGMTFGWASWVLPLLWSAALALCPCLLLGLLGFSFPLVSSSCNLALHPVGLVAFVLPSGWAPFRFALTSCWACWLLSPFRLVASGLCPHILLGLGVFLCWLVALALCT